MARDMMAGPDVPWRSDVVFWAGVVMALLGGVAMISPAVSGLVIGALAGWLLWLAGAVMLSVAFVTRGKGSFFGAVLASLLAIAAGAYLLFHPSAGAVAATLLVAAVFILDGASQLALALDLRPRQAWRWVLASSVASIAAAVLVATGWPVRSPMALGVVLGVAFVTTGLAFIVLGLPRRPARAGRTVAKAGQAATRRS